MKYQIDFYPYGTNQHGHYCQTENKDESKTITCNSLKELRDKIFDVCAYEIQFFEGSKKQYFDRYFFSLTNGWMGDPPKRSVWHCAYYYIHVFEVGFDKPDSMLEALKRFIPA